MVVLVLKNDDVTTIYRKMAAMNVEIDFVARIAASPIARNVKMYYRPPNLTLLFYR